MPYIDRQFRSLFLAMLGGFAVFGVSVTILGATLPNIIREFGWSYTVTGMVLAASSVGYFVATFLAGLASQKLGPKPVVVVGLLIQSAGLSLFAATPSPAVNLALNLMMGVGLGALEVVINFSTIRMAPAGETRLMNLMHAAFAVGAILGPFAVAGVLKMHASWQMTYRVMAGVSALTAVTFAAMPFSRLTRRAGSAGPEPRLREVLAHPMLVLSFGIILLYVGTEIGVSAWLAEYFVKVLGTSKAAGATMVSVFWVGLLVGRMGVSVGYRGRRPAGLLLALSVLCTVALALAIATRDARVAGAWFFVCGLGCSAIYPLVMAMLGQHFPDAEGLAVGTVSAGGGIGSFAFPFAMAAIADAFGLVRGFAFCVGLNILMTALIGAGLWQIHRVHVAAAARRS